MGDNLYLIKEIAVRLKEFQAEKAAIEKNEIVAAAQLRIQAKGRYNIDFLRELKNQLIEIKAIDNNSLINTIDNVLNEVFESADNELTVDQILTLVEFENIIGVINNDIEIIKDDTTESFASKFVDLLKGKGGDDK